MALLAATTLGADVAAETVHAEVCVDDIDFPDGDEYRLIIHSYDARPSDLASGRAKPVGSVQRVVTGEDLKNGVRIGLVELRDGERVNRARTGSADKRPMVVAWLEGVHSDYDFDAREARPTATSMAGSAPRGAGNVKIRLGRSA